MYFKVLVLDAGTVVQIGDDCSDETFTLEELYNLIQRAHAQEERAYNIVERRKIPRNRAKESAIHACLSHLDNLS